MKNKILMKLLAFSLTAALVSPAGVRAAVQGGGTGSQIEVQEIGDSPLKTAFEEGWMQSRGSWWYQYSDGSYALAGWREIGGLWYYFNENGWMQTGWQQIEGSWYYLDETGYMRTGWQEIGNAWYYLDGSGAVVANGWIGSYYLQSDGRMATNQWIGSYYVGADGSWQQQQEGWRESQGSWWYQYSDGSYANAGWQIIGGLWYYFDGNGWMQTGWQRIGGSWYYLDGAGYMRTGWQEIGNAWYYLDGSGAMAANSWIGSYYLQSDGRMATNQWIGSYYVGADGSWQQQQEGWRESQGSWWYQYSDGSYANAGWRLIGGLWYYFDGNGWMQTGWQRIGGSWYYLDGTGYMRTGWQEIGNAWYYLDGSGTMVANGWIGNYYLQSDGRMATNQWIGNYYVGADGKWVQENQKPVYTEGWIKSGNKWWYQYSDGTYPKSTWKEIKGATYYFDANGWMLTGWQQIGSKTYYLGDNGVRVTNQWVGDYFLLSDGIMAVNQWVDGRYVGSDGKWIPGYQDDSSVNPNQFVTTSETIATSYNSNTHSIASNSPAKTAKAANSGSWQLNADTGGYRFVYEAGGYASNGWFQIKDEYYHFDSSGWMTANSWIGNYYVNADGKWRYVKVKDSNGKTYDCERQIETDPQVNDLVLWTAIVYAEAGNQGTAGMSAVTMAILNRMESRNHPNDLRTNIYMKSQFEPARTGRLTQYLKNENAAIAGTYKKNTQTAVNNAWGNFRAWKKGMGTRQIKGIFLPAGKEFDFCFFMTPAAFRNLGLDERACEILYVPKAYDTNLDHGHIFFRYWIV